MAFTQYAIGRIRTSGNDLNGCFFDPSLCTLTDGAATSGTGTAPVFTSASYNFVAGDVGAYIFIKSGTNWIPGWYIIASVAANAATLTAVIGGSRLYTGDMMGFSTVAGVATTASPTGATWSVDYSQQNTPLGAVSDYTSTASTTITSVTAAFTVAMIGNAVRLSSGTGVTVGYYFITAVASATSMTVDRASGTYTLGVGKVGGGCATYKRTLNNSNATGDKVVPGNIVFIQGGGTDAPSSSDYSDTTSFITPVSGSTTAGPVRITGENGRPRFRSDGLMFHIMTHVVFENLYLSCTSNTNASLGIISTLSLGGIKNCIIDTNNQANMVGCSISTQTIMEDCEVKSGTTTPTFSAGAFGITTSYSIIQRCRLHHLRDSAVVDTGPAIVEWCLLYKNMGHGIAGSGTTISGSYSSNTIDGNAKDGINIATTAALALLRIANNIISNHTTSSTYGINLAAGAAALNDLVKRFVDYNAFYNNNAHVLNISQGRNDIVGTDPQYTDAANGDYSIGTNLKAAGVPGTWRGQALPVGYLDPGAVQRQEAGGGGSAGPKFGMHGNGPSFSGRISV